MTQLISHAQYIYLNPVFWTLWGITTTQLGNLSTTTMTLSAGGTVSGFDTICFRQSPNARSNMLIQCRHVARL